MLVLLVGEAKVAADPLGVGAAGRAEGGETGRGVKVAGEAKGKLIKKDVIKSKVIISSRHFSMRWCRRSSESRRSRR